MPPSPPIPGCGSAHQGPPREINSSERRSGRGAPPHSRQRPEILASMARTPLSEEDVRQALADLPGWEGDAAEIRRTVAAPDFPTGIRIVQEVAVVAEEADHHPDIDIRWRNVTFALTTHDAGTRVTDWDLAMARRINEI